MKAKILLVMPPQRRDVLMNYLEEAGMEVSFARNCREALRKLNEGLHYDLVLVDSRISGGSWREILQFVRDTRTPYEVIICSRFGDEQLWAEMIEMGAFDLIPEPYDRLEVLRILQAALESQYMRLFVHSVESRIA